MSCWRIVMRTWRAMTSGDGAVVCLGWSLMMDQASWAMDTIRLAAPMPRLAMASGSYWPGRCSAVLRAARAASTSAGRFGLRPGARITAAERAASAMGSVMAGRRAGRRSR